MCGLTSSNCTCQVFSLYMPGVLTQRERLMAQSDSATLSHNVPLLLPSAATGILSVPLTMLQSEWSLHHAQAHEALSDMRGHLEVRSHLYKVKDRFARGQRDNARALTMVKQVDAKINSEAERYCVAYHAMYLLSAPLSKSDWQGGLRPLLAADIRHVMQNDDGQSEGRRVLSWIWSAGTSAAVLPGPAADAQAVQGSLQECKSFCARFTLIVLTADSSNSPLHRVVQGASTCTALVGGGRAFAGGDAPCHRIPQLGIPAMAGQS